MPPPQRRVRRKPLSERITAALNPMDFLLWLSEELETREWDSKAAGTQAGLALNLAFLLARANSGLSRTEDDVFVDDFGSGWLSWFVSWPYEQSTDEASRFHVPRADVWLPGRSIRSSGCSPSSPSRTPSTP